MYLAAEVTGALFPVASRSFFRFLDCLRSADIEAAAAAAASAICASSFDPSAGVLFLSVADALSTSGVALFEDLGCFFGFRLVFDPLLITIRSSLTSKDLEKSFLDSEAPTDFVSRDRK